MSAGEIESKSQDTEEGQITARWLREIELAGAHEKDWRDRAGKVLDRYRDEKAAKEENRKPRFNILYANTEVLRGVLYQKTPVPDVRRRFKDRDPVGREAAQILQRAISYCVDSYDFDAVMAGVVEDVVLPGRGLARVKYVPTFEPMLGQDGQPMMGEDGKPMQKVSYETVETDYVEWDMVRISPAKRWSKVRWVAFGELLTRDELVKQFGELGNQVPLSWAPKDKENADELYKRALVWTIWDKTARKVHVVAHNFKQQRLSSIDDPLNLQGFFPCPRPVYSIKNTGTMVPIPEYTQYQDQAIELDDLTGRINVLVDALRRRGVYNGSFPELQKLASAGDNEFVAVEKFSELVAGGGIDKALWEAPVENIAKVLVNLYEQREQVKQTIYEITGLADIVRGITAASETLGAQQLKARYANSRTSPRQKEVQRFARDLFRIKAEIIAEKFSKETLALMTGAELAASPADKEAQSLRYKAAVQAAQASQSTPPKAPELLNKPTWKDVLGILRSDKLRGFRVDIETDSTIEPDAMEEQKNRVDLLTAITGFIEKVAPAVQAGYLPMEVAKEMLSFGVRAFKVSPQIEEALDQIWQSQNGESEAARKQVEAWKQQALADVNQQVEAAQKIIAQANEAKSQMEKDAIRADAANKVRDAHSGIAEREAALFAKEQQLETERQTQQAIDTMRGMIDQFTRQLQDMASKRTEAVEAGEAGPGGETADIDMMRQMHEQTLAAFTEIVNRLTMPRVLKRDPMTGEKMVVVSEA